MPVVHLVRHAQGSFGTTDYDVLSERGARQAAAVGRELARRGAGAPAAVVSGDLRRQRETAELAGVGAGLRIDPRWNEFEPRNVDVAPPGRKEDNKAFQVRLDAALTAWIDVRAPGTGWLEFRDQAWSAFGELRAELSAGGVGIAFTSGGVIAAIASVLWELPPAAIVALNRVMVNGSITTVLTGRDRLSLLSVNDHAHMLSPGSELMTYR